MKDLQGKVAVITGGASGIGRAVVERAAQLGMKVALADIEEGPLEQTAKELAGNRGRGRGGHHRRIPSSRHRGVARSCPQSVRGCPSRAQQRRRRGGRALVDRERDRLEMGSRREPMGRHPRDQCVRAGAHRARRGSCGQHGVAGGAHLPGSHGPVQRIETRRDVDLGDAVPRSAQHRVADRGVCAVPRVRPNGNRQIGTKPTGVGA